MRVAGAGKGRERGLSTTAWGPCLPRVGALQGGLGTGRWGPAQRELKRHPNSLLPSAPETAL